MESYLMMLYVTLEQESALKNFFVDQGWMFCKPDLSVTTDKLGPAVQNPPVVSEEISLPETDIPPQMKQTIPEIKINIPPSKPATGTSTVRRGKRKTKSPKQTAIRIKQAKVASASVPEPSESNENLVTEAVESNKSETLDTSKIKVPITVQVEDGNQFTIKIEQESEDVGNDKGEVDNSDVVGNDDFDDGDDDNDEETNVDYSFEGASTSEGDTSVKMESQSLGNNSTNVNTAAKGGSSGKHARQGKSKTKLKKLRAYETSNLVDAYNMVKELGVPVRRAAKVFNVPEGTLTARVKNRVALDVTRSGPGPILTVEEERKLTSHLIELDHVGYGYTIIEIIRQASDYAIALGKRASDNPFSRRWFVGYISRHQECDRVKPVSPSNQKVICVSKECIVKYYEKLNKIHHEYNLDDHPDNIYIMDEIDIELDEAVEECKTVTVIGAGSAAGQIIPPYFIMVTGLPDEDNIFMRKSQLITKGFKNCFSSHFMKYAKRSDDNEPLIVLYDGHRSHLSVELIEWAKEHHIVLFVIPPHECSIVKTRKNVFAPVKSKYNKECNKLLKQNEQVETSADVISVAKHAYDDAVSAKTLQSWFETTGVYPLQDGRSMCDLLASQNKLKMN
ncbi:uncharacterized protein LOC123547372 isoform X1 [Mercenaria mercenaria]|uniref:uncharacterized protein LOC123547372 isoform X1 n=1 Tax=Mercenaria mercenaria TaxID=6596 RepID=UPI00234EF8C9|nr:uncharacterized protein LOC123547372 isoform X1 [Mercenaria mercenaria]XP_053407616.1 uncharacterized protein LOC123547372 isoform X1 [Mercenaria mercenaria]XP_053407617.1 uncharacterized protein LOC123547372 isoform X1 [Mercenaria mercenaria]